MHEDISTYVMKDAPPLQSTFVLNLVNKFRLIDPLMNARLWCEPYGANKTRWVLMQEEADFDEETINRILNYANVADPDTTSSWTTYTSDNKIRGIHKVEKAPYSELHKMSIGTWHYTPVDGEGHWRSIQRPAGKQVEYVLHHTMV